MNAVELLHDWKQGDPVRAEELNALCEAVRQAEARLMSAPADCTHGGLRVEGDGVAEMPWQVYLVRQGETRELRVVPGEVIVGLYAIPPAPGEGIQYGLLYDYITLQQDAAGVEGMTAWNRRHVIYLELIGSVEVEVLDGEQIPDDFAMASSGWIHDVTRLREPQLRVTAAPVADALRVWPLAVWDPEHEQPLTQLQWGTLSALEMRCLVDREGHAVVPSDSTAQATWGGEGHEQDMAILDEIRAASAAGEQFNGKLYAAIAADGAMEFYLGSREFVSSGGDSGGGGSGGGMVHIGADDIIIEGEDDISNPWDYPPEPDEPEPDEPDPQPLPGVPPPVRYGYVAGEGFESCELMMVNGEEMWVLTLNPTYLASICADLECKGTVTFNGSGSTGAWLAAIDMGLGSCSATATGSGVSGSAGLLFHGTNSVNTSKKTETITVTYKCSPQWVQNKRWLLSTKKISDAGAYVIMEAGTYDEGFVNARHWYRVRIDKAKFRKHAAAHYRIKMGKVQVSACGESTSGESAVSGELSGSMIGMVATFVFS